MSKRVRIPPYGMVHLSDLASRLIQTPEFLRLQHLKQLGFAYLVYPTATHTRFEHSIGTSYLAKRFGLRLLKDGYVTEEEVAQLEVAALLHDIGHGPFSHAFELATGSRHEEAGAAVAAKLLRELGCDGAFVGAVTGMMLGAVPDGCEKPFLFEIVANRRSGLDVDKMDYLLRDHLHCFGTVPTMDPLRIMDNMGVMDGHLVIQSKEAENVLSLFALRAKMHSIVYQHRVCIAADLMFAHGVRRIDGVDGPDALRLDDRFLVSAARGVDVLQQLEDRRLWPSRLYTGEEEAGWTTVERQVHYGKEAANPLDSIRFVHDGEVVREPCAELFLPRSFRETLRVQIKVPGGDAVMLGGGSVE